MAWASQVHDPEGEEPVQRPDLDKFGGLLTDGEVDYGNLPQVDGSVHRSGAARRRHRATATRTCKSCSSTRRHRQDLEDGRAAKARRRQADRHLRRRAEQIRARRQARAALRDTLVDIAARGRHLNVVLFGAAAVPLEGRQRDPGQLRHLVLRPGRRRGDHQLLLSLAVRDDQVRAARSAKRARSWPGTRISGRRSSARFPLKPTVDGMVAQRIFNSAGNGFRSATTATGCSRRCRI